MFLPDNEEMKNNKIFFVEEGVINLDWFVPREEAVKYFNRDKYEKQLIDFIDKQFVFDDDDQLDIHGVIENSKLPNNNTNTVSIHLCL